MPRCMSRARSRRGSRQRRGAVRLQARCGAHVAAHQRCRMVLHNRCVGTVGVGCRPRRRHCQRLDRCRGVGLEWVVGVLVWVGTATVTVAVTVTLVVWCPSQCPRSLLHHLGGVHGSRLQGVGLWTCRRPQLHPHCHVGRGCSKGRCVKVGRVPGVVAVWGVAQCHCPCHHPVAPVCVGLVVMVDWVACLPPPLLRLCPCRG